VAIAGYIPVPLAADDYIGLLPIRRRKINSNGVKIGHRVYHSDEPGPLSRPGPLSGPNPCHSHTYGAQWTRLVSTARRIRTRSFSTRVRGGGR